MLTDKEIKIGLAEWQMWKQLPTTKAVFEVLADERSAAVQRLAFGDTLQRPGLEVKETAEAVGYVAGIGVLLDEIDVMLAQREAEENRIREEDLEDGGGGE